MHIPVRDLGFYRYWCWLWIVLGSCSVLGGCVILVLAAIKGGERQQLLFAIGVTTIIVGALRLANSVAMLRKIRSPKLNRLDRDIPASGVSARRSDDGEMPSISE